MSDIVWQEFYNYTYKQLLLDKPIVALEKVDDGVITPNDVNKRPKRTHIYSDLFIIESFMGKLRDEILFNQSKVNEYVPKKPVSYEEMDCDDVNFNMEENIDQYSGDIEVSDKKLEPDHVNKSLNSNENCSDELKSETEFGKSSVRDNDDENEIFIPLITYAQQSEESNDCKKVSSTSYSTLEQIDMNTNIIPETKQDVENSENCIDSTVRRVTRKRKVISYKEVNPNFNLNSLRCKKAKKSVKKTENKPPSSIQLCNTPMNNINEPEMQNYNLNNISITKKCFSGLLCIESLPINAKNSEVVVDLPINLQNTVNSTNVKVRVDLSKINLTKNFINTILQYDKKRKNPEKLTSKPKRVRKIKEKIEKSEIVKYVEGFSPSTTVVDQQNNTSNISYENNQVLSSPVQNSDSVYYISTTTENVCNEMLTINRTNQTVPINIPDNWVLSTTVADSTIPKTGTTPLSDATGTISKLDNNLNNENNTVAPEQIYECLDDVVFPIEIVNNALSFVNYFGNDNVNFSQPSIENIRPTKIIKSKECVESISNNFVSLYINTEPAHSNKSNNEVLDLSTFDNTNSVLDLSKKESEQLNRDIELLGVSNTSKIRSENVRQKITIKEYQNKYKNSISNVINSNTVNISNNIRLDIPNLNDSELDYEPMQLNDDQISLSSGESIDNKIEEVVTKDKTIDPIAIQSDDKFDNNNENETKDERNDPNAIQCDDKFDNNNENETKDERNDPNAIQYENQNSTVASNLNKELLPQSEVELMKYDDDDDENTGKTTEGSADNDEDDGDDDDDVISIFTNSIIGSPWSERDLEIPEPIENCENSLQSNNVLTNSEIILKEIEKNNIQLDSKKLDTNLSVLSSNPKVVCSISLSDKLEKQLKPFRIPKLNLQLSNSLINNNIETNTQNIIVNQPSTHTTREHLTSTVVSSTNNNSPLNLINLNSCSNYSSSSSLQNDMHRKIFGPICYRFFLSNKCIANNCKYSHMLNNINTLKMKLKNVNYTALTNAYKFICRSSKLFLHYLPAFVDVYTEYGDQSNLLAIVKDCETYSDGIRFIKIILNGLIKTGFNETDAIKAILTYFFRFENKSFKMCDLLIEIIIDSDCIQYLEFLKKFLNISQYKFKIDSIIRMAQICNQTKHLELILILSGIVFNSDELKQSKNEEIIKFIEMVRVFISIDGFIYNINEK